MTTPELNALSEDRATEVLRSCCGAERWARGMAARRPFADLDALLCVADDLWWSLGPEVWNDAFSHHPRIGAAGPASPADARARSWSAAEQRLVTRANAAVREELARLNSEYERRFGYIYIVCATDKSAEELLVMLQRRLGNDPAIEIRVAAEEQAKITRLRLRQLLARALIPATSTVRR